MKKWSIERAQAWAEKQPWFFGANFIPSTAINQLEMWQADTFDRQTIEQELGYAQGIGMNIMRVYLHDLLWEHDREGFVDRIEQYLTIADAKGIKTMFVIFDDCWNGEFALGPQPEPIPFHHNSGWVQSPGHTVVEDPAQWPRLERYVKELLTHFKADPRVVLWDLYNEPGNGCEGDDTEDVRRRSLSVPLLQATFDWARSVAGVSQPLTVASWHLDEATNCCIAANSDVVSFHAYQAPHKGLINKIENASASGRPVICSEYMARKQGSTFAACLPILRERCAGAINWGLVSGKTQTIYPWGWNAQKGEPSVYLHDVFHPDGSLLYPEEEAVIRETLNL